MKQTTIVNIYNFVRMSHVEPSRFLVDDFETIRSEIILVKQYGFPGTYALKYDALMDPRYQALFRTYLDGRDEISAWWEITEPLCRRSGVPFRGKVSTEYDDRVDSAYCVGYEPEERKRLVDAYMRDFYGVYGQYPRTIGSWVLDSVTLGYAAERYGVLGGAICRDQMGTDGFTLWGGFPNGIYYPCRKNEFIPAQTLEEQLPTPMFRLLGPDPIYNFEQDVRPGLQGVYTLEPSWLTGRDPKWLAWFFGCLCEESCLGVPYAHVGQENNFLWENIRPGLGPQLALLRELADRGAVRVETMADSAAWFRSRYVRTPPMSFQASRDWDTDRGLSAQWYASSCYRVGFLGEAGHLRIRDLFLYREDYPSRYYDRAMEGSGSVMDALPVLFPQAWGAPRPFLWLRTPGGREPEGRVAYAALDDRTARAELWAGETRVAAFTMEPHAITPEGSCTLVFDRLPVLRRVEGREVVLEHRGFFYGFRVARGRLRQAGPEGLEIEPEEGTVVLTLGSPVEREAVFRPVCPDGTHNLVPDQSPVPLAPPMEPEAEPGASVFPWGAPARVTLTAREPGRIHYTLDGREPGPESPQYQAPLVLERDTVVSARLFSPDGRASGTVRIPYRFGLTGLKLKSPTTLDVRPVFSGNGLGDLLSARRGSLDYLDGHWRGTLEDLELQVQLPESRKIRSVSLGFLSHHRSGIVYPEWVELEVGPDLAHLRPYGRITLPCVPCAREIAKEDVTFQIYAPLGAFRLRAHRYETMPQWCCYRGSKDVFLMSDSLIVTPWEITREDAPLD